ncbi:MAG: oligosaccharide flippase family protein [Anaerolineae bacterium]
MSPLHHDADRAVGEETLASRAVRGGLWVALSSGWTILFGFGANLLLTRILAPEAFGAFALASFFFAVINIRSKAGLGPALAQRQGVSGELVGTHLALDVAAGLATLLLAGVAVPVLRALSYTDDVVWVVVALAAIGVSDSFMGTAWILLDRELCFGRTSLVNGIAFPLSYLPAFWLAWRGAGYWSLVAQSAAYALLLLVGMWWVARRRLPWVWELRWRLDRDTALRLLRFGVYVGAGTVLVMLATQFDNFLVGTFVSLTMLGFYDRAYRIAQWPSTLVSSVLSRTALYTYARLQDDPVRLSRTVSMTFWLITLLALPLALAIFVAAPDLVLLLYGVEWLPSAVFVRLLVVYSLLRPLLDVAGSLFTGVGKPHQATLVAGAQAVALLVVATPLTFSQGAVGTAVGVGVAFVMGLVVAYLFLRRTVHVALWREFGIPALSAVAAMVAYWALARLAGVEALSLPWRVLAKACFAPGAYLAVLFALQPQAMRSRLTYVIKLLRGGSQVVALEPTSP